MNGQMEETSNAFCCLSSKPSSLGSSPWIASLRLCHCLPMRPCLKLSLYHSKLELDDVNIQFCFQDGIHSCGCHKTREPATYGPEGPEEKVQNQFEVGGGLLE
uniref:Uncharacterized protein n=1 Tax=Opuntia streptacantha TaxID=393608 RepID=A0A7C8ZQC8_OPUST